MKPVTVIPVQVPYHLYMKFKDMVHEMPMETIQEWNDWRQELYQDGRGKLPVVQYYVGSSIIPDVYGFFYSIWIVASELKKCQ